MGIPKFNSLFSFALKFFDRIIIECQYSSLSLEPPFLSFSLSSRHRTKRQLLRQRSDLSASSSSASSSAGYASIDTTAFEERLHRVQVEVMEMVHQRLRSMEDTLTV